MGAFCSLLCEASHLWEPYGLREAIGAHSCLLQPGGRGTAVESVGIESLRCRLLSLLRVGGDGPAPKQHSLSPRTSGLPVTDPGGLPEWSWHAGCPLSIALSQEA